MGDLGATTDAMPAALIPVIGPGAVIASRYRVVEPLGAGGAGAVWRARDLELDGDVALKLLAATRSDGEVERWRREVAMARRIAHRNVCRVHDLGEHAGTRYVTMELVHGRSLRSLLGPGLAPGPARELLAQIVDGAAAIHAAGVVHRDLKPDNVVVDDTGRAVIVDFGLAREPGAGATAGTAAASPGAARVTQHGVVVGTPAYMSPEQAAGSAVDPRTDVWALGLIAHELVTGGLPAGLPAGRGDPAYAPTAAAGGPLGTAPPRPVSAATSAAIERRAPGLGAIISRCLAPDPDDRFPDAIAIAAALARPRRTRRRALVIAGAAALVAAAGAIAIAARAGRPTDTPRARRDGPITQTRLAVPSNGLPPGPGAVSSDGRRIAYTVHGRLYVGPIGGGDPVEWRGPAVNTAWAWGFFPDGAVVVLGAKPDGGWGVWRVAQATGAELLHEESQRMTGAISRDGTRLAIGVGERGIAILDAATRESHRLVSAARGELITGVTWSPDGHSIAFARSGAGASEDTIEIATVADGATRVIKRGFLGHWVDQMLIWPEPDRLLYTAEDGTASTLRELDLASLTDRERMRWAGEYVGTGNYGGGVLLIHRGKVRFGVWTAELDELGHPHGWARATSTDVLAGRVAGWTADGRVVYGERSATGVMAQTQAPGQPGAPLPGAPPGARPETLADDAVIVRQPEAGGRIAIARVAGGAVTELTTVAADGAGNSLVRCAGDRAPPCVLEQVRAGRVTWTEIDPMTGAAGAQLHETPPSGRFERNAALSPDGRTLAVVDGGDAVTFVERGRAARTVPVGRGAELYSVTFAHDGRSVLVTALGHLGYIFNVIRVGLDGSVDDRFENSWHHWYFRASESRDGKRLAADTNEFLLEIWRVDGI